MLRAIGRHVTGFWPALAAFLAAALFIGVALTAALVALGGALDTASVQSVDGAVLHWFADRRTPALDRLMHNVTTLGDGIVLIVLVAVAAAFLWLTRLRWAVHILVLGVVGGTFVNPALKAAFGRPRPDLVDALGSPLTQSFPSGHAMSAIITYGSIAWLIGRLAPRAALRTAAWFIAVLLIAGIGISRLYLGVHYPTDVLGGYLAGLVWLGFIAASAEAVRYFGARRRSTPAPRQPIVE